MLLSFIISFKRTNRITYFIDDWEQRKSKEVCSISTGKSNTQDKVEDGDYPFYVRSAIIERSNKYLYDEEAVLTVGDGVGTGKVYHLVNGKYDLHQRVYRMFDFNHGITIEYFFYYFSKNFYKRVQAMTAKTSVDSVRLEMIAEMKINYPNQNEQIKIGNFFKQLDDTITLQERKLSLLKLMKKGFLQQLFPKNEQVLPDIRFTNFQEVWQQRKFEDIIEIKSGKDYKHLNQGNIPVYGTGGYMLSVDKALSYDKDAIGIGRKGTINNPYLLHAPFWTVDTLFYAIPIKNNNLIFIKSLFQLINWNKFDESTGVPSLSKAVINKVNVKVPENKEQSKIGDFFSQLEKNISFQEKKIEELKQVKIAFLQKLFI